MLSKGLAASGGDARTAVLGRIRRALGGATSSPETAQADWEALPRGYKRTASLDRTAVLALLVARLTDYDARVVEVQPEGVAAAVKALLVERGAGRLVVPKGMPTGVLPEDLQFVTDQGLSAAEFDEFDGVVTMATVAIAETGTIVLQHAPGQGRRAMTLVPDHHVCVVRTVDVVETVSEAVARLQGTATLATTFVSGPSATADIEMTRIKGVHGPRFLDVVLVSWDEGERSTGEVWSNEAI